MEYFEYVIRKYFRKIPPIPTNLYLNSSDALEIENRAKVAELCHFPTIVNTLARDENEQVQQAAMKNEFWILIGQLQDVLGFDKKERKEFARQEVFRIILVLLMFEDDLDIIGEALRNASISTQMNTIYIQFIKERGGGKKDQQILKEAQKILAEKKQRIIKAAEITKARKNLQEKDHQYLLLLKLADEDNVIRKAIGNILVDIDPEILHKIINLAIERPPHDKILNRFIVLTELLNLVAKRDDIKRLTTNKLSGEKFDYVNRGKHSIAKYFTNLINRQRRILLDKCQEDLTDLQHILLLAHCHCDPDPEFRKLAANIISIDDIFSLVNDISTPQHLFKSILDVLSEHPSEEIQHHIQSAYHEESERLWSKLKELEQSVHAYFDIVFQTLGFNQINEFNISIKNLEQAERTIYRLVPRFEEAIKKQVKQTVSFLTEIKNATEMQIYKVNADVSTNRMKELQQILELIQQIFDLRNIGMENLRPGLLKDIDPELLNKARKIWQSALGQFLGRIKHLNEMVKIKFSILAKEFTKHEDLQQDFAEAVDAFEKSHKEKIDCKLKVACSNCNRRGCASERFLTETEFFIDELLDNFVD